MKIEGTQKQRDYCWNNKNTESVRALEGEAITHQD